MNWDHIEGNWSHYTLSLRERWGRLSHDQLEVIAGKRDVLARKIRECYGLTPDDAERQLATWQDAQPQPQDEAK